MNVVVIDPPGYRFAHFLFDTARFLQGAIEECGVPCSVRRNDVERGAVNLLVGVHLVDDPRWVEGLLASEIPFVVLQTEIVTAGGFNGEATGRFESVFLPLARGALSVWESSEPNLAKLRELGVRVGHLRFGYVEAVREPLRETARDLDFFFCGSVTPRRRAILERLAKLGYRVEVRFDDAAFFRRDLMARSEIILSLRQSDELTHVPAARILHAVCHGRLVAGDHGTAGESVEDLYVWEKEGDVVELLRETRARADRRALAETFRERLRARPMRDLLMPLVDELRPAGEKEAA
jgi:hypothetical protein